MQLPGRDYLHSIRMPTIPIYCSYAYYPYALSTVTVHCPLPIAHCPLSLVSTIVIKSSPPIP